MASGDRTELLRRLEVPTLVIHGLADRMCDVSGGRAVAEAIPGARARLIEGMGHNLPPGLRDELAERIAAFVLRPEPQNHQPLTSYAPVHCGLRLDRNASTPSLKSALM